MSAVLLVVAVLALAVVEKRVVPHPNARGLASASALRSHLGRRQLRRRAPVLRPTATATQPEQLGVHLGRVGRRQLWGSIEDSYLLLGPPRSGKTTRLLTPWLRDYPGPAVVTSTRPDLYVATRDARAARGPVFLFDPTHLVSPAHPHPLPKKSAPEPPQLLGSSPPDTAMCRGTPFPEEDRTTWDLTADCTDPLVAILRARAIVAASRSAEGVRNADFWRGTAETVLRCFLHAAALSGEDVRAIKRWVAQQNGVEALAALRMPGAAEGWASDLAGLAQLNEETRSNVFAGVQTTLSALSDPRVSAACAPSSTGVDIDALLTGNGTLYLIGTSSAQQSVAPIVVAFVEAIVDRARRLAAAGSSIQPADGSAPTSAPLRNRGGRRRGTRGIAEAGSGFHGERVRVSQRLDPPLGVFLDEAAQIAPLPSLPQLVADGGGSGITPVVALQSLAQARDRWGDQAADAIWDASTVRLVLGGLGNDGDLQRISRLCGEVRETVHQGPNAPSVQRMRPVLSAAGLRGLRPGRALLLYKGLAPAVLRLAEVSTRSAQVLPSRETVVPSQERAA